MMGRVREMLSLQAETGPLLVDHAMFSLERAIEKVSGVDLNPGLIGSHAQDASAGGFVNFGGLGQTLSAAIDYPILVVAARDAKWFVIGVDTLSDARGLAEIQRGPCHGLEFAGRNQIGIGPGE